MKFKGVTPSFSCSAKGNGLECSPDRARWPSDGFWADVCVAHMQAWQSHMAKLLRHPWTGRLKGGTNGPVGAASH